MRITQRYATKGGGIVSFPAPSRLEIFGVRWMQCEVEGQPQHLRVADEPNTEENRHSDHDRQRQTRDPNPGQVIHERARSERRENRESVSDCDVGKEISALTHEKITAGGTAFRTIEVSAEKLPFTADRAAQSEQRT